MLILDEITDLLLLLTIHWYNPVCPSIIVRVWMYSAVTGFFNTVLVSPVITLLSLFQVTLVTGPPVDTQTRAFDINFGPSIILTLPADTKWEAIII